MAPRTFDNLCETTADVACDTVSHTIWVSELALAPIQAALQGVVARLGLDVRFDAQTEPPMAYELLRFEELDGRRLGGTQISRSWHRPPYALAVRLVRYAPMSTDPEVLDIAVIGTRGRRDEYLARLGRIVAHLLEDAIRGTSRGETGLSFDAIRPNPLYLPAKIDRAMAIWHARLFSEWWSVGTIAGSLAHLRRTQTVPPIHWFAPRKGDAYLADPFPWQGRNKVLCEEMPVRDGIGRIVALEMDENNTLRETGVVLEDDAHHSYPCTLQDEATTYFIPESTNRGATTLYQLIPDKPPIPLCAVAPEQCLADPTLFMHGGYYWIACTDLDIGSHDNLCLLYASVPNGPWRSHRCVPVKIDVCGARPAGAIVRVDNELLRPGQDCARTYGAGVVIHRIDVLSPERYHETVVARLRPDPNGSFPDGLHTVTADATRVWLDGKRFVFDPGVLYRKLLRRISSATNSTRRVMP